MSGEADAVAVQECTHIARAANTDAIRRHLLKNYPQLRSPGVDTKQIFPCSKCGSRRDVWLCLHCCAVLCGRTSEKHAMQHFEEKPTHCTFLNVSSRMIWCYSCDEEVLDEQAVDMDSNVTCVFAPLAASLRAVIIGGKEAPAVTDVPVGSSDAAGARPAVVPAGVCGLTNVGNTCFLSAVIQALSNVPAFAQHFCTVVPASLRWEGTIADGFGIVLTDMWSSRFKCVNPAYVHNRLRRLNPMFEGYGQHDAHEAMRFMLSDIHEKLSVDVRESEVSYPSGASIDTECMAPVPLPPHLVRSMSSSSGLRSPVLSPTDGDSAADSDGVGAGAGSSERGTASETSRSWLIDGPYTGPPTVPQSIVSDLFRGTLCSRVRCRACRAESITYDQFYDLSLTIPKRRCAPAHVASAAYSGAPSERESGGLLCGLFGSSSIRLVDCLYNFCESEPLVGRDQYFCETCKERTNADRALYISQLPEVLCIHVKRFNYSHMWGSKVSTTVTFPLEGLDMSPFLRSLIVPPEPSPSSGTSTTASSSLAGGEAGDTVFSSPLPTSKVHAIMPSGVPAREDIVSRDSTVYDLVSVVEHIGSLHGGHYISFGKNRVTGQWHEFDDAHATPLSSARVEKQEAYLLFYCRRGKQAPLPPPVDEPIFCYVSQYWWNKYLHSSKPGPCSAAVVMCDHGFVKRALAKDIRSMVVGLPTSLWESLSLRYGRGRVLMQLGACSHCETEARALEERREREKTRIREIDSETLSAEEVCWYIISEAWLRSWRSFIDNAGAMDGTLRGALPPGPIANHKLLRKSGEPLPNLKRIRQYRGINSKVWNFLFGIYGGGPAIRRKTLDLYDETPI